MQDTVLLRMSRGAGAADRFEWLSPDTEGGMLTHGTLQDAAQASAGKRLLFLAPGEDILLTQANIPARNRQRLLQALPYALEDRLVQDIEASHFAAGTTRRGDGSLPVAVVERARLEHWLETLAGAGVTPDRIVPDVLAVPFEPGSWTVLDDGGMALVRHTTQGGFAIDRDGLAPVLAGALEEAGEDRPEQLLVYAAGGAADELEALSTLGVEIVVRPLPGSALALLASHVEGGEAIDLLQGDYSRREQFGRAWRPWLPAAIILALLLVLNTGMLLYEHSRLSSESARLQSSIENIYRETFPESQRVVNARVQMERGLEALRRGGAQNSDFLDMMSRTAEALRQTEGLVVQRINYRERRLDLSLLIRDLQQLDGLVQRIGETGGMPVEVQSASAVEGRIEARLQVRAAP